MTLQGLFLDFGGRPILNSINEIISAKDRIGIIGDNGAGKTSLLKLITGEYTPVKGTVNISKNVQIGYLEQNTTFSLENTVFTEARTAFVQVLSALEEIEQVEVQLSSDVSNAQLLERHSELSTFIEMKDGHNIDTQVKKVLNGMGFLPETHTKLVKVLSGGERTALALAKLLLFSPEVLVLDEPTNHLDINAFSWLENFLKAYNGAVVVVSHDRYFLDQVVNRIWEIDNTYLIGYKGNYSAYLPQKEATVILQEKQHKADVEKAAKLQDYIDRNLVRASTSKMAKSRRKTLEKMEITEKPRTWHHKMSMEILFDNQSYEEVITVRGLSGAFGSKALFHDVNFMVRRGEALVIAGPNGSGKSTLLKMLTKEITSNSGAVRFGQGVRFSVFTQQQSRTNEEVIQVIWNKYPTFTELEVRSHLAKFGFLGEDVYKSVMSLSGGEVAKLRFAELVLEKPNLLFLDEPTNHLDIFTKEALESTLVKYEGTKIVVTHDRYFMQRLNCPILYIENGEWALYKGYAEYLDYTGKKSGKEFEAANRKNAAQSPKEERKRKAEIRMLKSTLENDIEKLHEEIDELELLLQTDAVAKDYEKLMKITSELSNKKYEIDSYYEKWEQVNKEE